ncbi:TPA: hypothetical protein J2F79_003654 [Escherichia coli]|nr:hypothetical protein [Escherichia coli]HBA6362865.1 hypothetical protein [Escherichia coli]
MTVKAKRFRIGVEGATTDGREIQREWLEQMAASYNPAVYTALINLEHIKSYLPDSTFNRYGKVTALFAEEITESNTTKVTSTNSYAKLTINGEVLYEVDLINMVETVDGVDLMEAHRNALGL